MISLPRRSFLWCDVLCVWPRTLWPDVIRRLVSQRLVVSSIAWWTQLFLSGKLMSACTPGDVIDGCWWRLLLCHNNNTRCRKTQKLRNSLIIQCLHASNSLRFETAILFTRVSILWMQRVSLGRKWMFYFLIYSLLAINFIYALCHFPPRCWGLKISELAVRMTSDSEGDLKKYRCRCIESERNFLWELRKSDFTFYDEKQIQGSLIVGYCTIVRWNDLK